MTAITVVGFSWLVLLFTLSGVPMKIANRLPTTIREVALYGMTCVMCFGFYVGYALGVFNHTIFDIPSCLFSGFLVSSTAMVFKVCFNAYIAISIFLEHKTNKWSE